MQCIIYVAMLPNIVKWEGTGRGDRRRGQEEGTGGGDGRGQEEGTGRRDGSGQDGNGRGQEEETGRGDGKRGQ